MAFDGVQVPPDSTGKKIQAGRIAELEYVGGTIKFAVGTVIVGQTSGASATVNKVVGDATSGDLYISYENDSSTFVIDENLLVGGLYHAKINNASDAIKEAFIQYVINVGANNDFNRQHVDIRGSSHVRYTEGSPQFDAFGAMRMSTAKPLANYTFKYSHQEGSGPLELYTETNGSGTVTHIPESAMCTMQLGTASGKYVRRTSNKYHPYTPGNSQLINMTVVLGDTGKNNVTRKWGYFDKNNGVYFELKNNVVSVVLRSSSTGVLVEERIAQADWEIDKCDGSEGLLNLSQMTLDVSKLNIYWFDLQWLGAGRVRYGVVTPAGERIVVHEIQNANLKSRAYMGTAALPVCWEINNDALSPSTSEMSIVCCAVKTEGESFGEHQDHKMFADELNGAVTVSSSDVGLFCMRSALLHNGLENRKISLPETLSIISSEPIELEWRIGVTATGGSWVAPNAETSLEVNKTATVSGGTPWMHMFVDAGVTTEDIDEHFSPVNEHVCLRADGNYGNVHALVASSLSGNPVTVRVLFGWFDMH